MVRHPPWQILDPPLCIVYCVKAETLLCALTASFSDLLTQQAHYGATKTVYFQIHAQFSHWNNNFWMLMHFR